jgi:hypothetical protein
MGGEMAKREERGGKGGRKERTGVESLKRGNKE